MNTDIEILTDSETITAELLEEEEEQDRQEAIALKAEIIKLMADFFVALGEKLKICQEKRLYRFEAETFGAWCEQEVGIQRAYAYRLIRAYEIYTQIQNHMSPIGDMDENDYQNIPLPTSERQLRPLSQLPEDQWFPTWCEAVERNGSTEKPPAGTIVEQIVREKKAMETASRYQSTVERFKQGEIVRITAKYNTKLKEYHSCWGQIVSLEEHSYTILTWKGTVSEVAHDDLMLMSRVERDTARTLLSQLNQIYSSKSQDPDCVAFLHYLGTKPDPSASEWAIDVLNFSLG